LRGMTLGHMIGDFESTEIHQWLLTGA
jgi:hypothetical protein